jgi:DNA-binding NarL/FixJ family response regulator
MEATRLAGSPVRVLVVDADRRVRQSLVGLCGVTDDLAVIGAVMTASGAIDCLERTEADVVLIDPRLPEVDSGLALMVEVHHRWPTVALVAMSSLDDVAHPALSNGALAFVAKSGQPEALLETVRRSGRAARMRAEADRRAHEGGYASGAPDLSLGA